MFDPNRVTDLQFGTEKQIMDRKSARIRPVDLAIPIVAMANADGGWLAIGIEDDVTFRSLKAEKELDIIPADTVSILCESNTLVSSAPLSGASSSKKLFSLSL